MDEEEPIEIDDDFEAKLNQEGNMYDVSEFGESMADDDNVSLFSHRTGKQNKNFIPEDADLDQVVEQLLSRKTKHLVQLEREEG
jgi:hypothetical protein